MHAYDPALARSRAYGLFGRLFLEGLAEDLLPAVRAVPDLGPLLPTPFDADAAAADHFNLFGLNLQPHAAIFLDASGMLGGYVSETVAHHVRQTGYVPDASAPDDHLGHILGALSLLCGAEADALSDATSHEAERMRRMQVDVLDACLLGWLPAITFALRRDAPPFFRVVGDLTLELALDHRASLRAPLHLPELPEPPGLLDDPGTGLKDVAHYLAVPPWSGLLLSRDMIVRLGRADRLPRGFGNRVQMLTNLLRAAVDYDRLPSLLTQLEATAKAEEAAYLGLPPLRESDAAAYAAPWLERIAATLRLLERLRTAVP